MSERPPGRPRTYDREAIALAFERYIAETDIPIVAEFAHLNATPRDQMYEWEEPFPTLLKSCIAKKEAALERRALKGEINVTMAIFSLKQLGWKDKIEHSGDEKAPLALALVGSDVHG